MFGIAGRRLAETVVALFALLGFAFVPLGQKTALEHARGIFTTPAALDAWRELAGATARLKDKLVTTLLSPATSPSTIEAQGAKPELPALPGKKHR